MKSIQLTSKKVIWIVLTTLFIALLIASCSATRNATSSTSGASSTGKVQKVNVVNSVEASGTIAPAQLASLYWQTTGNVGTVNVKEGDQVKANDVLMSLNPVTMPASVLTAQQNLASARKNLEDIYTNAETTKVTALQSITTYAASVRDAQYQLENYIVPTDQQNLDPMQAMDQMKQTLDKAWKAFEPYLYYHEDNQTRSDLKDALDQAQSEYDAAVKRVTYVYVLEVAQANLDKARQDYEKLSKGPDQNDIDAAKAQLAAAEATAAENQITAPFDGEILSINNQPGDVADSSTAAVVLANRTKLYVDVQVDETEIAQVKVGNPAAITLDALPDAKFTGKVTNINPVGAAVSGVVNYGVRVELDKADPQILLGATANVSIQTSEPQDFLSVPVSAVQTDTKGEYVNRIAADGTAQQVRITSGQIVGERVVVVGDLKEGDLVSLSSTSSSSSSSRNNQRGPGIFGP
jgi:RND family efflux transporter MFP subunit